MRISLTRRIEGFNRAGGHTRLPEFINNEWEILREKWPCLFFINHGSRLRVLDFNILLDVVFCLYVRLAVFGSQVLEILKVV